MEADRKNEIFYVEADSYDGCVEKIRKLHGRNYQIVRKKFFQKGGFLGFGSKEMVEVAYIVLPETNYSRYDSYADAYMRPVYQNNNSSSSYEKSSERQENERQNFEKEKEKILKGKKVPDTQIQEILDEVKAIRGDISEMQTGGESEHETVIKIQKLLEDNEFTPSYIRKIIDRLKKEFTIEGLDDFNEVQETVVDWIGETIKIGDIKLKSKPEVIILVGPTGVGKTTTVAKIAAKFSYNASLRVRLLNADNYRIGGKQQLQIYASILSIPMDSIDQDGDFIQKVNAYDSDTDVIIVDTFGCSPKDYEKIGQLRARLESKGLIPRVYLTMAAMAKASDMRDIIQQFEVFSYSSVIVTKLDETSCVGNLISVLDEKEKSVAYLSTGQNVPADIEDGSVIRLLQQLNGFKINMERLEKKFPIAKEER